MNRDRRSGVCQLLVFDQRRRRERYERVAASVDVEDIFTDEIKRDVFWRQESKQTEQGLGVRRFRRGLLDRHCERARHARRITLGSRVTCVSILLR